jgi:hypothetical protein
MEKLERERAWREEEFDFILQFLRTILLKREWQRLMLEVIVKLKASQ